MSVPPSASFLAGGGPGRGRPRPDSRPVAAQLVPPVLPVARAARTFCRVGGATAVAEVVTGYRAAEDVRHVQAPSAHATWRAALGYYRPPPAEPSRRRYTDLHRLAGAAQCPPCICMAPTMVCHIVFRPLGGAGLPEGSHLTIVEGAGHFLQLDRPDVVAGQSSTSSGR